MSTTATTAPTRPYVDATEAARLLDLPGRRNVYKLVRAGLLTVRSAPSREKYARADVERLAQFQNQDV